ncbi:NAD(P)-dependent oxidoreductase [Streptomyces sp. IBSBF 2953]|nr:NAD(P)-dependent oxidoreductase [Streptomyces hayashii]
MTVVVLGATGFLGRHICAALRDAGRPVRAVARSGPTPVDLLHSAPQTLAAVFDEADAVVNAAGRAWQADARDMERGNVLVVRTVLDALRLTDRRPRLIQLGSVHEYGTAEPGTAMAESRPPRPLTPYGRTKLEATRAVLDAADRRRLDATVLRVANVCGPGAPRGSLFGLVAAAVHEARQARRADRTPPALRVSPLRAHRDVVDVRDVADAVVAACAPPAAVTGRVINVGAGRAVHMRTLVDRAVALGGVPLTVDEASGGGPATAADWQLLDIALARRLLGWRPRRGLDDMLGHLLSPHDPPLTDPSWRG